MSARITMSNANYKINISMNEILLNTRGYINENRIERVKGIEGNRYIKNVVIKQLRGY